MSEFTAKAAEAKTRWAALIDAGMDNATQAMFTAAEENATDTGLDEGYERGAPEWYEMWSDTFAMLQAERAAEAEETPAEPSTHRPTSKGNTMANLTRTQKRDLAALLLSQAGNIVEFYEEMTQHDRPALHNVPPEAVAQQLATWLKHLPGDAWDTRLPQPK